MADFDWSDYLSLSVELLQGHGKVTHHPLACWRTVVSRSYYAAFHVAEVYGRTNGGGKRWKRLQHQWGGDPNKEVHEFVRQWFVQSPNDEEKKLGAKLYDLRDKRKEADYKGWVSISEEDAEWAREVAHQIIEELKRIAQSS